MSETLANGRYTVVRRLAVGGMGEVLLADFAGDDALSPGLLVVKRILSAAPGQPPAESQIKMLQEEGRLGLRLLHSNVVETFRFDVDDNVPVLVIELLAGKSMAQVLGQAKKAKAPIPIDVALSIIRGAACGLHFAHTLTAPDGTPLGLVHRDVSPANIFVTYDGAVKVIDFGVAKSEDSEIKTATGILKGKLGYMSPEQSLGAARLTAQADVWSLGVFFWEMLLAERLFTSPNPTATLLQITQKEIPRPSSIRPDIPPAVEAICMRMLARPLEERFVDCAAVARAIDALPRGGGVSGVDLGGFLAERYPEEAAAGAAEAARCARPLRRVPIPSGLTEGSIRGDAADEDEFATAVLPASTREALLGDTLQNDTHDGLSDIDEDAATVRVTADVLAEVRAMAARPASSGPASSGPASTPSAMSSGAPRFADEDEDEIATRPVDADMLAKLRNAPRPATLARTATPQATRAPPPPPNRAGGLPAHADEPTTLPTDRLPAGMTRTEPVGPPEVSSPGRKSAAHIQGAKPSAIAAASLDPAVRATTTGGFQAPVGVSAAPAAGASSSTSQSLPRPTAPVGGVSSAPVPAPSPAGRVVQMGQRSTQTGPHRQVPMESTRPPSRSIAAASSSSAAAGSWVSVAVTTFGALVVVLGVVFSALMPAPAPRVATVYADPAGFDVIVGDPSAVPVGRQARQLDLTRPILRPPGSSEMDIIDAEELRASLEQSGVWARLSLPGSPKSKVAAMLPLLIVGLGGVALAIGGVAMAMRGGGRLALQIVAVVAVLGAVGAGVQFGALGWPGRVAWEAPTPTHPWKPAQPAADPPAPAPASAP